MRHSIKKQLIFSFLFITTGTFLMCWFVNLLFFELYYMQTRKQTLQDTYEIIDDWSRNGDINSEEFDDTLLRICSTYNIEFIIADAGANIIKTSISEYEEFLSQLQNAVVARMEAATDTEGEGAYIITNVLDEERAIEYLVMWGKLGDGNFFMLRTSLEGIRDNAHLANGFMFNVGTAIVVISSLVILLISKRISDPILELTKISERMAKLDFDAKYTKRGDNEIDVLGSNFNKMSETLEETIRQLKNANLELQKDVENKTRIDNLRKEFLANVSHELKTPIALIQGYAEGLKENVSDDPEQREFYLDVIMDETMKMNQMVKKLMTLNQLEFGEDKPEMEYFNVVSLLEYFIQSSEIITKQKGIEVIFEEPSPVYVWADEHMTEEVFRNYFNNAIQYADGDKQIRVSVTPLEDVGKVRIGVFNTGRRIDEDVKKRLWDKFYKADKARSREYGGSGIGLSIVKAMMEAMGQAFGVENKENGVEFWFELETK